MYGLRKHFGDELNIRNEKIAKFVRWYHERPTDIIETDKIAKEITFMPCFITNNLHQRYKGCDCVDNKDCNEERHDVNDQCKNIAHCQCAQYKETSDGFHFWTTFAAIRMPHKIPEYVVSEQREEATTTKRSISAHHHANHQNDYVNTLKMTHFRSELNDKSMKRRDDVKS